MKSLGKLFAILDLFHDGGRLTPEDMAQRLALSRSTLYRYLKALADAGLLTPSSAGTYTLGPRIAELDYQMRTTDPLIAIAQPVMAELVANVPGIALLCRRYRNQVLCVHQERGAADFQTNYERGRARPLLRGAASRIILAHMPPPAIRRLHAADPAGFARAGLGRSAEDALARLKEIRGRGIDITTGELTPGVTGVAAPIFDADGAVLGSLSVTLGSRRKEALVAHLADQVSLCARIVTASLAGDKTAETGKKRVRTAPSKRLKKSHIVRKADSTL